MANIAQVIVNIPARNINKIFSYIIPEHLHYIAVGWRVLVSFGNRKTEGFIVGLTDEETAGLKPIIEVLDDYQWFDNHMLATAKWLSEYYLCTFAEALRLFIPGLTGIKTKKTYQAPAQADLQQLTTLLAAKSEDYRTIVTYIYDKGPICLTDLGKLPLGTTDSLDKIVKYLLRHKLIIQTDCVTKRGQPRYITLISLAVSREVAIHTEQTLLRAKPAQRRLLCALLNKGQLDTSALRCLNITQDTVKRLQIAGLITAQSVEVSRNSYAGNKLGQTEVTLTLDQKLALDLIIPAVEAAKFKSFVIHGVTGSGKTQVYIKAVAAARQNNRQAIVLVPEIALTSQIIARFTAVFGDDVVVMHSKLSVGERHDSWRKLRSGQAGIIIGARSALFAPVDDLGIIIIDEEHEFTYKQEEAPRYHARDVALTQAKIAGAVVVLGSATPSVETYYLALNGEHTLITMNNRIGDVPMPPVTVVDMRAELAQGRRSVISQTLQDILTQTLAKKEQAIILLNRRGYSTFVLCRDCGHVLKCSHCDIALVYHSPASTLRCHYCQERHAMPDTCPECGSRYIRYFGAGTQKVEEALVTLFPTARIVRMDQDTTSGKMAHDKILSAFATGQYDILLGTQMVAKGHDIPNVTAVGIISADTSLNLPDFRAAEKTFSLLTQTAGRAGRGVKPGRVVLQTYNPEHYAVTAGAEHNYQAFYNNEINFRRELNYPPFTRLIKITVQAPDEHTVHRQAGQLASELNQSPFFSGHTQIIGPFPASVAKIKDVFRVNILIKTQNLASVRQHIGALGISSRQNVTVDIDPVNIL